MIVGGLIVLLIGVWYEWRDLRMSSGSRPWPEVLVQFRACLAVGIRAARVAANAAPNQVVGGRVGCLREPGVVLRLP